MRVTPKSLREHVHLLQKMGADITIQWAYGQPRCFRMNEAVEISPRLAPREMYWWLQGFYHGYIAKKGEQKPCESR